MFSDLEANAAAAQPRSSCELRGTSTVPSNRTGEVKVTAPGRRNRHIKEEIIVDSEAYQTHPDVERMVFVVYDLASTITNPRGFESDLSRIFDGYPRDVLAVPWPYLVCNGGRRPPVESSSFSATIDPTIPAQEVVVSTGKSRSSRP